MIYSNIQFFFNAIFKNFLEPPSRDAQWLIYTALRKYLPKSNLFFAPLLVHLYVNKEVLQCFS